MKKITKCLLGVFGLVVSTPSFAAEEIIFKDSKGAEEKVAIDSYRVVVLQEGKLLLLVGSNSRACDVPINSVQEIKEWKSIISQAASVTCSTTDGKYRIDVAGIK